MTYTLRAFREDDAETLAALTLSAIRSVGSARYSSQQIDAWASRHPGPQRFIDRAASGDRIFVATGPEDIAIAYVLLEPECEGRGHLDMLYCHPEHTRRGIADLLLTRANDQARADGVTVLFTEASELARPAFERGGYVVTHRRDFDIEGPDGPVTIHNYAMEKILEKTP